MRLLGLDVGIKKIGVAFCDTDIGIVFPREVITVKDLKSSIGKIKEIVAKDRVDKVVIGLPLNFNSTKSKIQEYVEDFSNKLKEELNIDIELFDERFTTRIAERFGVKNVDSVSAVILLEDYIKAFLRGSGGCEI
ncbi:MAG: Holliday junction resolvase RuvX [Brevinematia bacterium]